MTVNRLRAEMTDAEFVYFAAYYELKSIREQEAMDKASSSR